jgi:hypothetical protein
VVPKLDEIAHDPKRVSRLSKVGLSALLWRCAAAQSTLVAELESDQQNHPPRSHRMKTEY